MVQRRVVEHVELIKSRRFQGGKIFPLWQMFRKGHLTGEFHFSGTEWSTMISLDDGRVRSLEFEQQGHACSGLEGLNQLKSTLENDEGTRFTILVPQETESV